MDVDDACSIDGDPAEGEEVRSLERLREIRERLNKERVQYSGRSGREPVARAWTHRVAPGHWHGPRCPAPKIDMHSIQAQSDHNICPLRCSARYL